MLGEKIKEIRTKFGLTQEELAEKLNVSRQAVAKWELGNGLPDTENLKAISKLFGTSIDTLLDNTTDIPLMVLHQEINLKDYGKTKGEQYLNILNKNFDNSWKIYVLTFTKKVNSIGGVIDLLTFGLSNLEDLSVYYLAIKDNCKQFINIKKDELIIKALNFNTNIEKFTLDKKVYYNMGELKR